MQEFDLKYQIKEKFVSAIAHLVVWGAGMLITWSVFYAYIGRQHMDKVSETINTKVTNYYNEGVKRDAEIVSKQAKDELILREILTLLKGSHKELEKKLEDKKEDDGYLRKHIKQHVPIQEQRLLP